MEINIKDILKMIKKMEKENIMIKIKIFGKKEYGKMGKEKNGYNILNKKMF